MDSRLGAHEAVQRADLRASVAISVADSLLSQAGW